MKRYVSAEWLKRQVKIIGITTGDNFEKLIDAAPSIDLGYKPSVQLQSQTVDWDAMIEEIKELANIQERIVLHALDYETRYARVKAKEAYENSIAIIDKYRNGDQG